MWCYLHGFASGRDSAKGTLLARDFAQRGRTVERLELTPGERGFEESTPHSMRAVLQGALAKGTPPHALIGSSLGGYLSAWEASENPAVERLVLLAPAFDLATLWTRRGTPEEHARWRREGLTTLHFGSGRHRHLGPQYFTALETVPRWPKVTVPTLVFAGRNDDTVPLSMIEHWCAQTPSAKLVVLDDGHELLRTLPRIIDESWAFLN